MISRDKYINQLIQYQNNGMPKVITGISEMSSPKDSQMDSVLLRAQIGSGELKLEEAVKQTEELVGFKYYKDEFLNASGSDESVFADSLSKLKKAYSEKDGISKAETELVDAVADKTTEIKRKEYSPAVK